MILASALLISFHAESHAAFPLGPGLRVVALTGEPAPGTGTTFARFGPAEFDGAPAISLDATIGFAAVLSDGSAGFWIDRGSGLELLSRSGSPAPGTEPGVVFSQRVSEIILLTPPLLAPGEVALRDTLAGPGVSFDNDFGLWRLTSSGLALIAREGMPIPGLQNVRLSTMSSSAIDASGRAVLSALLAGAVVDGNNESICRASTAGLELLEREGDSAPGAGFGVVFATASTTSAFPIVLEDLTGELLFEGDLHGPGTSTNNDEALFVRDASGTRLLLREGDPVPGLPGFVLREGSTAGFHAGDIAFTDDAHLAIVVRIAGAGGSASALLVGSTHGLAPLVRTGDQAPGTGGRFDLLSNPFMNRRGEVAFRASLVSRAARPSLGLWISTAGSVRAIALPGQPVPGVTDAAVFRNIRALLGFNDKDFALFTAELVAADGRSSSALILAEPAGETRIIARTGGTLAIAADDQRAVDQIIVRPSALGAGSHVAFAVRFTDGTGAELVSTSRRPRFFRVEDVSPGTAGRGGLVPLLAIGADSSGDPGTIEISGAVGGARGAVVLSLPDDPSRPARFDTIALACGSALARGRSVVFSHTLSGTPGVAGDGGFVLGLAPFDLHLAGTTFYVQAGYLDPAACGGISLTDIVRVRLLPRVR